MKWLNQVQLIGYLGADPLIRQQTDNRFYALMNVATHNGYSKKTKKRTTQWHTVKIWGRNQNYIRNNFIKGSHVLIDGRLRYYACVNGTGTHQKVEIVANRIMNLDR